MEPMQILLVTDYCAKGSLYDIIENEDIKLDNLFIASLINDLIKVNFLVREKNVVKLTLTHAIGNDLHPRIGASISR